jgi:Ni,Fe-hydrogenase III component G
LADETNPVATALAARFPALAATVGAPRARRVKALVERELFREVLDFATGELGFDRLCAITGLDEKDALAAIYALGRADGTLLSLEVRVPRDAPTLDSVTDRFPGAANYERELDDLLGFDVRGLPPGKRYPLPDDWPKDEKPLRKDWKPAPPPPGAGEPKPS